MNGLELLLAAQAEGRARALVGQAAQPAAFPFPVLTSHLVTPGEITARLRRLDADAANLNASIVAMVPSSTPNGKLFRENWERDYAAWRAYYEDNSPEWKMLVTGTGTISRALDAWRDRIASWDREFRTAFPQGAVGPKVFTPLEERDVTHPEGPIAPVGLPWWAISGLTLVALGALGYLGYSGYRYFKEGAKDIETVRRTIVPAAAKRFSRVAADPDYDVEHDPEVSLPETWPPL